VPHVPPPFSPWNPTRLYHHLGKVSYFNVRGNLVANYRGFYRFVDFVLGFIKGLSQSSLDIIADHSMQYYISYAKKALQQELEDQSAEKLEKDKSRA
jgi:hypothetical protein